MTSNMIAMEDCTTANGVFLYTRNLDTEFMLRCLQMLLNNFPDIKFISIITDEKCLGYKVHFSNPDEETILAKKNITVSGQDILICPLTTCLTIHNINTNGDSQLENHICEAINNRFGKILYRIAIAKSKGHQNDNTMNWRAYINVPEVKELTIFDHEGFSEMCMWLPNKKEKLKVTFCCRRCKKDGHIQQDCLYSAHRKASATDERMDENDSNSLPLNPVKRFDIPLDSTESFAEKVGREEVMKTGILLDEIQKVKEAGPSESIPEAKMSKEINMLPLGWSSIKVKKEKSQNTEDNNNRNVPKEEPSNILNNNQDSNSSHIYDDIDFKEYRNNLNSSKAHDSFHLKFEDKAEATSSDEALSSPTRARNNIQRSSSTSSATPGPSNTNHGTPKTPKSVEITSILSERLQDCINSACDKFRALNRQTLDAFLIHVKKKSNPLRVAKNYTENAIGLKEQLQHILKLYYNTPQTGTKDDIAFIKWLNGLVDRFEGTVPKKRKRAGQNHDDTQSKK